MDGRLRLWLTCGLVAATLPAVGCKLFQGNSAPPSNPNLPQVSGGYQSGGSILQAGFRKSSPPNQFLPTEKPETIRPAGSKSQDFKADTDVAIADAELAAAFEGDRPGTDRDRIIDVSRQRYQHALAKDPQNKGALLGLAKLYTWAGDRDRAVSTYNDALKHHPRDPEVAFALMRTQIRFEDWAGACKACEYALDLDPENRTFRKAYGVVLARAERWDDAFDNLVMVMGESQARTFLGRMLIDTGRMDQGREQLQAALQKDPGNETARRVLTEMTEYQQQVQQTGGTE